MTTEHKHLADQFLTSRRRAAVPRRTEIVLEALRTVVP
jgi:hypothetical protein